MKKSKKKNPLFLLIAVILISVLLLGSVSILDADGDNAIKQIILAKVEQVIPDNSSWDATEFLVGEFYASTGCIVRFDGRGRVTYIQPDGQNAVGEYSMSEQRNQVATVTILLNGRQSHYRFDLLSDKGAFTLKDEQGDLSVYTPVQY